MSLSERDKAVIWHPYTQHKHSPESHPILRGKGAYVFDEEGKAYLDLISSWWVTLHGHCHPAIAKAIYEQAMELDHVLFAGFTHEPAVALAEKILALAPAVYSKVFYSDNGSTAVEVALKMAYQYWRNQGEKSVSVLSLLKAATTAIPLAPCLSVNIAAFSSLLTIFSLQSTSSNIPPPGRETAISKQKNKPSCHASPIIWPRTAVKFAP